MILKDPKIKEHKLSGKPGLWDSYYMHICKHVYTYTGFLPGPQCGRPGFVFWVGKIPWRRTWQSTLVFLPGELPWTEEPGGLQSMGSQRVGHDWANKHSTAYTYTMDRGAWRATVYRIAKSMTRLKQLSMYTYIQLSGHEFEQTPGADEGQQGLACYSSWGRKVSDTT